MSILNPDPEPGRHIPGSGEPSGKPAPTKKRYGKYVFIVIGIAVVLAVAQWLR